MMNLFYRSVNIGHELIFLKRQFFLICILFLNRQNSTRKLPTDIISGGELEFSTYARIQFSSLVFCMPSYSLGVAGAWAFVESAGWDAGFFTRRVEPALLF